MKKESLLRVLVAIAATTTTIAAFIPGVGAFVSPELAIGATAALLAIKEIVVVIGDYADNGKRDGSFTALLALLWTGAAITFASCALPACSIMDRVIAVEPITDESLGLSYLPNTKQPGGKLVLTQASWDLLRDLIVEKWPGALPVMGDGQEFGAALIDGWAFDEIPGVTEVIILPN
jgi:hypothetical protein